MLVFIAALGLSLVVVSRGYVSLWWLILLWSMGSREHMGFNNCSAWVQ